MSVGQKLVRFGGEGIGKDLRLREQVFGASVVTRFEELIALAFKFLGHFRRECALFEVKSCRDTNYT